MRGSYLWKQRDHKEAKENPCSDKVVVVEPKHSRNADTEHKKNQHESEFSTNAIHLMFITLWECVKLAKPKSN